MGPGSCISTVSAYVPSCIGSSLLNLGLRRCHGQSGVGLSGSHWLFVDVVVYKKALSSKVNCSLLLYIRVSVLYFHLCSVRSSYRGLAEFRTLIDNVNTRDSICACMCACVYVVCVCTCMRTSGLSNAEYAHFQTN